jgi:hypothetical protein
MRGFIRSRKSLPEYTQPLPHFPSNQTIRMDCRQTELECQRATITWSVIVCAHTDSIAEAPAQIRHTIRCWRTARVFLCRDGLTIFICLEISPMKPLELLGQALTPDGDDLKLTRCDHEYIILLNGKSLMSSLMHGSEEALATFACHRARTLEQPCVLVGGLGMGFTLRATLDLLPSNAIVVVTELVPDVVKWNRDPLGSLASHPLKDRRVRVEVGDVAITLRSGLGRFDAVLLDVDNGPSAFVASDNAGLYDDRGIAAARAALRMDGVLAVWSARYDQKFERRLRYGGFVVQVESVRGRLKKGGPHHFIYLAHNPS